MKFPEADRFGSFPLIPYRFMPPISKILVFLPDLLGDVVIGTPVYRAIREHFGPKARVVGVMRQHLFGLFGGSDWFDELWPFRSIRNEERLGMIEMMRRIRAGRFELALMMSDSIRAALACKFAGVPRRIGYGRYGRDWALNEIVPQPKDGSGRLRTEPLVHYYLRLAGHLSTLPGFGDLRASRIGSHATSSKSARSLRSFMKLELGTLPEDEEDADELLKRWGIRNDRRIVFLHSSGFFGTSRRWPEAYLAVLSQMIVDRLGHDVVILNAPGDEDVVERIVDSTHRDRVFSIYLRNYGVAKALLKRGRLMVSTDSGLARVAQAVGLPIICLYGPSDPLRGANPAAREEILSLECDCQGCEQRHCPKGHTACMNDLFPERVFYQVEKRLGDKRKAA
ncbi:MAG TPA: hypothetical protein DEB39_01500 [Planctomycetaceae bacterium]|nr:hypothetical protein [Planctomycetaceae bacterium]